MYQLVAIDLDETLYDDNHNICERNIHAIHKAIKKGVKIVPASGRTPGMLKDLYETLNINSDEEYSILGNGAILIRNQSETVLDCTGLPFAKAKELFFWAKERGIGIEVFTPHKVMFFYVDEEEKQLARSIGNIDIMKEEEDILFLEKETILKLIFLVRDDAKRAQVAKALTPLTKQTVSLSYSSNRYIELNQLGINKGVGLRTLAKHLSIDIKDIIAIGDNMNDLEMLKEAGLGVAMQNALPEVKQTADIITHSNNNEGGVAEIIERFILSK